MKVWSRSERLIAAAIVVLSLAILARLSDEIQQWSDRYLIDRSIDRSRFENLYRAGKQIEGGLGVGISLIRYRELLQELATEVSIASDLARWESEREMVAAFAAALATFKYAETTWTNNIRSKSDDQRTVQEIWITAGRQLASAIALYNGES